MSEWKPIETAPCSEERIVVWVKDDGEGGGDFIAIGKRFMNGHVWADGVMRHANITHWLPAGRPK